jgi:DeoR family fructose operon transcriptional repressor
MFAHERQSKITALLEQRRQAGVVSLQRELGVSAATLRRDLAHLQRVGKLVRTHGGVMHAAFHAGEPAFERKARAATQAKSHLAKLALGLVPAGATVFIDAGTTTLELGRLLLERDDLTLFTNSLPLLNVRRSGRAALISVGGEMREISRALVGSLAMDWLRQLRFDLVFLGASALDVTAGASTTELLEASIKREVIARARRAILLADHSKWRQRAPIRFAAWNAFADFVTDQRPSPAVCAALKRHRVKIHAVA